MLNWGATKSPVDPSDALVQIIRKTVDSDPTDVEVRPVVVHLRLR